jgi:hypothetical protein
VLENRSSFHGEAEKWADEYLKAATKLHATSEKFQNQLRSIFCREDNSETKGLLTARIEAGSAYFLSEQAKLGESLICCPAVTDSRLHAKELNEILKEIFGVLSLKRYLMEGLHGEFNTETYHQRKRNFILPAFGVNVYAGSTNQRSENPHPVLHQKLRKLRDTICSRADLPIYIVAGTNTLDEMVRYLPQSLSEIRKISGFGDAKTKKYGQQFLDLILEYCGEKNLSSLIHDKLPKKEKQSTGGAKKTKVDTKAESFRLYKGGKQVDEIAQERNLTQQTIEGHLAYYISKGEINIDELVSREKVLLIEPVAKTFSGGSLTPIKEKLGSAVSYGEIRLVLAWIEFQDNQRPI